MLCIVGYDARLNIDVFIVKHIILLISWIFSFVNKPALSQLASLIVAPYSLLITAFSGGFLGII